jgi:hypothetical protein
LVGSAGSIATSQAPDGIYRGGTTAAAAPFGQPVGLVTPITTSVGELIHEFVSNTTTGLVQPSIPSAVPQLTSLTSDAGSPTLPKNAAFDLTWPPIAGAQELLVRFTSTMKVCKFDASTGRGTVPAGTLANAPAMDQVIATAANRGCVGVPTSAAPTGKVCAWAATAAAPVLVRIQ